MIIINQQYGQLCNQVFLLAHFYAYAAEKNVKIHHPGFYKYEGYFPRLCESRNTLLKTPSFLRQKQKPILYRILRLTLQKDSLFFKCSFLPCKSTHLDHAKESSFIEEDKKFEKTLSDKLVFFEGWQFRTFRSFSKHKQHLRELFSPSSEVLQKNDRFFAQLPKTDRIVGIHMRYGDYRKHCPQWVYSKDEYFDVIRNIEANSEESLVFVIVSNENLGEMPQNNIYVRNGNEAEDLYTLARCDYILGPPSTFNRWAAFWGDKPHFTLEKVSQDISLRHFSKFRMCDEIDEGSLTPKERHLLNLFGIV